MTRLVLPLLFLAAAGLVFFQLTQPLIDQIDLLRAEKEQINIGLGNIKKLRDVQDKLLENRRSFSGNDLRRLNKFLPDVNDNVRFIIELNNIARAYNMMVKNIRIRTGEAGGQPEAGALAGQRLGTVTLGFSVSGPYGNFQSFLADLSRSLRLIDASLVSFASNEEGIYDYTLEVETYWLK